MAKRKAPEIDSDLHVSIPTSFATTASGESSEGQGVYRQDLDNTCDSDVVNQGSHEQDNIDSPHQDQNACGKKQRLVWSRQLHAKFIEAVKILGHNAVPTKILRLMNEPEVTREQVASHLQKYRLQLKKLAGLPPDAPLDNQTKEIMQATQNIFAATLPNALLPGLVSAIPVQTSMAMHPQLVYSLPQGLTLLNNVAAMSQPLHTIPKAGLSVQQPILTTLGPSNMMALNMLPVAYNYNPYNVMLMSPGMYGGMAGSLARDAAGGQTEHRETEGGGHEGE